MTGLVPVIYADPTRECLPKESGIGAIPMMWRPLSDVDARDKHGHDGVFDCSDYRRLAAIAAAARIG
jgi:hypothetical protein